MAVSLVAAAAFHWFGVDYAAGAPVDVTGWSDRAIAQLIKKAPVVAAASGGSTPVPLAVQFKAQAFFTSGGGRSTNVYLHAESLLFDGVNNTGNLFDSVSSGSLPVGAGQQVIAPTACTISGIPDSEDGIDLDIYIIVTNQDGSESMRVSTNVVVPPHTSSYAVQVGAGGDFSTDWTVGTDLTAIGASITSAAGGQFTAIVSLDVVWD